MSDLEDLRSLAEALGVQAAYVDGLGRRGDVPPDTLVRVCAALGAAIDSPAQAREALRDHHDSVQQRLVPPVLVALDGHLSSIPVPVGAEAELVLEDGPGFHLDASGTELQAPEALPMGYHRLTVHADGRQAACTIISAPTRAWRRPDDHRSWGLGSHLAALRSTRSRTLGDLQDLLSLCRWVGAAGGDLVTVLPLLPTFNRPPAEPSPYSPVSRLFWSELVLDLGAGHRPVPPHPSLDVTAADAEVRAALTGRPAPEAGSVPAELARYAAFRGAQARLGRDWRAWPGEARAGRLDPSLVDAEEQRFHLVAQTEAERQLAELRSDMQRVGVRLGLDLAVGVHPDGYDPWSRQELFAEGMSGGAPPDPGFPSGQDWGFPPVLPQASRREGHRYLAASIAHQAGLSGVLRVDHIMALARLFWIPHGASIDQGTYVTYPTEELFAVLTLESHRNQCEIVGENLGTVPPVINEALPRHGIRGMLLTHFEATAEAPGPPSNTQVALIGTHDTPTLAGWVAGVDIHERVRFGLLNAEAAPPELEARAQAVRRLATVLETSPDDPEGLLGRLLEWLGRSASPLVIPWLEDLWLEDRQVNLPGTSSAIRPNWQRPMRRPLDEALADPRVAALVRRLDQCRKGPFPQDP